VQQHILSVSFLFEKVEYSRPLLSDSLEKFFCAGVVVLLPSQHYDTISSEYALVDIFFPTDPNEAYTGDENSVLDDQLQHESVMITGAKLD